jgi:C_GCAxxG_C_C family probable redox protein
LQDILSTRDDNILKAASGFSGGIGVMGDVCGALLGASMILSLKYGREREDMDKPENMDKLISSCEPIGKLYKWFEKEFGSAKCREIQTRFAGGVYYDFKVPWQAKLAEEAGILDKCHELVGKTVAKTIEMMWDDLEK